VLTAGCPAPDTTVPGNTALSQTEGDATQAAVNSAESVAQAVAPLPTIAVNTIAPPNAQPNNGQTFGDCPATTLSPGNDPQNLFTFNLSSDFGADGCEPEGPGSFRCSGVLVGTLAFISKTVTFTFGGLTCAGRELQGTAVLTYGLASATQVTADGTLDMDATDANGKTEIDGAVESTYDTTADTTTIDSFEGVVSDGSTQRNCSMTACVVNFKVNQNFIPLSGTMVLTGDRTVTITFDANSPVTGVVQVSIDGGAAFAVNLNDL
jgi:hypothetical protein